jgi:hypothetical protein
VRGRRKAAVAALLAGSAAASGALAGFAAGVAWLLVVRRPLPPAAVLALAVAALAADVLAGRRGRPRPLAVGRQVPAAWGRLFAPTTVAVLYGARLGIGPLTILPTWLWWAAAVAAAALGPGPAALAGAVFGAVRGASMILVAEYVRHAPPQRMARLRATERRAATTLATVAVTAGAVGSLS